MGLARLLLAGALALGCLTGVASAQSVSPDVLAISAWAQRLAAAQQPVVEAYNRCQPVTEKAAAAFDPAARNVAVAREIMPKFVECVEMLEAAATQTSRNLASIGALPRSAEAMLNIRSVDVVAKSAAAAGAMSASMRDMLVAIEAAMAGEHDAARTAFERARTGSVAVIDTQILLMEVMAKGASISSQRALLNMRIVVNRAIHVIVAADVTPLGIALGDALSVLGKPAREAVGQIRAAWASSAASRRTVERLGNPEQKARQARLTPIYGSLIEQADATAAVLESAPSGTVSLVEAQRISQEMAKFEFFTVQMTASISNVFQEHR